MALVDTTWYCSSVGWTAVTPFAISTAYTAGQIRRQLATPTVGNERCFIVIIAGTSAASEPAWVLTRGAKTVSGTVTFQECTGEAALNGDLSNTQTWAAVKAATPAVLGQIIKRSSGASYQICTTAGAMSASEPAFSDTAGVTTTDTTAVWTSLGAVGSWTGGMAPHARLQNVFGTSWFAAGNTVFVSSNHAEAQTTTLTLTPLSSGATAVNKIICHNVAGSYPPASGDMTTGAVISTNGAANIAFNPAAGGTNYLYGLTFRVGVGQTANNNLQLNVGAALVQFDRCSLEVATTHATPTISISNTACGVLLLNNTTVKFANVAQKVLLQAVQFLWQNTGQVLVSGSSVPTILLGCASSTTSVVVLEALDLSQLTGSLIDPAGGTNNILCTVRDCKLHASTTITAPASFGAIVQLARSSS